MHCSMVATASQYMRQSRFLQPVSAVKTILRLLLVLKPTQLVEQCCNDMYMPLSSALQHCWMPGLHFKFGYRYTGSDQALLACPSRNLAGVNYVCTSTAPGANANPPPASGCKTFAAAGAWCEDRSGTCCAGAPKNAKCECAAPCLCVSCSGQTVLSVTICLQLWKLWSPRLREPRLSCRQVTASQPPRRPITLVRNAPIISYASTATRANHSGVPCCALE